MQGTCITRGNYSVSGEKRPKQYFPRPLTDHRLPSLKETSDGHKSDSPCRTVGHIKDMDGCKHYNANQFDKEFFLLIGSYIRISYDFLCAVKSPI